ncbi:MAG: hypothetical protein RM022_030810, partial [Nostoc sp. EfeVER01]|uniref:hypothetical protein n=1 Tax=Nostoc sp. EfeVER01 TaxID=3075406 RepID=UPI002AD52C61
STRRCANDYALLPRQRLLYETLRVSGAFALAIRSGQDAQYKFVIRNYYLSITNYAGLSWIGGILITNSVPCRTLSISKKMLVLISNICRENQFIYFPERISFYLQKKS